MVVVVVAEIEIENETPKLGIEMKTQNSKRSQDHRGLQLGSWADDATITTTTTTNRLG